MKKKAEEIYNKAFSVYHSPYSQIWVEWDYLCFSDFRHPRKEKIIDKINELFNKRYRVKCGYSSTAIRGVHNYFIFYKKQK